MTLASSVAGGVGFTAIIVSWLAYLNPFGILLVSFCSAFLKKAAVSCNPPMDCQPTLQVSSRGLYCFYFRMRIFHKI